MSSARRFVAGALATSAASFALTTLILTAPASAQTAGPSAVTPPVITTSAGNGSAGFSGDGGSAISANVNHPSGMAEDLTGAVYIADTANNRVRRVSGGTITTVAGNGSAGFSGDGGQAKNAQLSGPTGVAVDSTGNLYIADARNGRVRKVNSAGLISTVAGNGSGFLHCGSGGNGGPATSAGMCLPTSVAVDSGNLYIADTGNNQIRKVAAGTISGVAGSGAYGSSGDGGAATAARLANPTAVALDSLHSVYFGDSGNNKIRKVTGGTISTFAGGGKGSGGQNGDGGKCNAAQLNTPSGLGIDGLGNVYIADTFDQKIRVCIPKGDIFTYAGTGASGYSGDGGPATAAKINYPSGNIAVDANNIFFGDTNNNRVRRVTGGPPPNIPEIPVSIALLPVSAALLLGAGYAVLRRRRITATMIAL